MANRISASHILIMHKDAKNSRVTRSKDEAYKIASELFEKIKLDKNIFKEMALQHSDCSSASAGGNLGEFGKGVMVSEFEDKAFSLEINELGEPIESDFGFHIIKRDA